MDKCHNKGNTKCQENTEDRVLKSSRMMGVEEAESSDIWDTSCRAGEKMGLVDSIQREVASVQVYTGEGFVQLEGRKSASETEAHGGDHF